MGENNLDTFIIAYTVQCRMIKNTSTESKTAKILLSCHDIVDNKRLLQELCINVSQLVFGRYVHIYALFVDEKLCRECGRLDNI